MKSLFTISLFLIAFGAFAQDQKTQLSKPLDISLKGWNRVLYMSNYNTLLFHFEPSHMIEVKVFDSGRKEKPARKDQYKVLYNFGSNPPVIKGLFEINGEAVLFIDQEINSKHCLVRLRYDATNGRLIEEKLVAESKGVNTRMQFYVIKNRFIDSYEILFCTDKHHPRKETDLFIVFFDSSHTSIKEIQLPVNRKKFDNLTIVGAEYQPEGVMITAALTKTLIYGPAGGVGNLGYNSSLDSHYLQVFHIDMANKNLRTAIYDFSTTVFPYYTFYTCNPFAQAYNIFLYSHISFDFKFGLNTESGSYNKSIFMKIDEQNINSLKCYEVNNEIANDTLKKQRSALDFYDGIPVKMMTNENGLSTIISEAYINHRDQSNSSRYDTSNATTLAGITQTDDDGKELWGTVLPCGQHYSLMPRASYSYHFTALRPYSYGKDFFIVYNDYDHNLNNSLKEPGYIINDYENTNAFYYKINSKKEVTKNYLFGAPAKNEFKCVFTDADYFNEHTGEYAALIQYKKGESVSVRMAWSKLK